VHRSPNQIPVAIRPAGYNDADAVVASMEGPTPLIPANNVAYVEGEQYNNNNTLGMPLALYCPDTPMHMPDNFWTTDAPLGEPAAQAAVTTTPTPTATVEPLRVLVEQAQGALELAVRSQQTLADHADDVQLLLQNDRDLVERETRGEVRLLQSDVDVRAQAMLARVETYGDLCALNEVASNRIAVAYCDLLRARHKTHALDTLPLKMPPAYSETGAAGVDDACSFEVRRRMHDVLHGGPVQWERASLPRPNVCVAEDCHRSQDVTVVDDGCALIPADVKSRCACTRNPFPMCMTCLQPGFVSAWNENITRYVCNPQPENVSCAVQCPLCLGMLCPFDVRCLQLVTADGNDDAAAAIDRQLALLMDTDCATDQEQQRVVALLLGTACDTEHEQVALPMDTEEQTASGVANAANCACPQLADQVMNALQAQEQRLPMIHTNLLCGGAPQTRSTRASSSSPHAREGKSAKGGNRRFTCSLCKAEDGHYAPTCPGRDENGNLLRDLYLQNKNAGAVQSALALAAATEAQAGDHDVQFYDDIGM
jgi:hypothetical protein